MRFQSDTQLAHLGRPPHEARTTVNVAVQRASTVLFDSVAELERAKASKYRHGELYYGTMGTQTAHTFEKAMAELEGGYAAIGVCSGLAACTSAILAFARKGDHILVSDSVYDPTRAFCDGMLSSFGVETTYYDPTIGERIAELMRPNTKLIFLESPGSHTFEIQDVPTICRIAHQRGAITALDNTWATPLYFRAFDHGVDVSIHAATKYVGGHSDLLVGVLTTTEACFHAVRTATAMLGHCLSPDDAYMALRGLRTMGVRLERQQRSAFELAHWLQMRPEVVRVLHPALESDPGHALWKRDFSGAAGLFAFILPPSRQEAVNALIDGMQLFGLGYSWGGFESLILQSMPNPQRGPTRWDPKQGTLIRLSVGLEDVGDLRRDLEKGLERWSK